MKNARRVLFAFLLLSLTNLQAQEKNADTLVHRVFAALKAKDQQAFIQLYPNAQQFGRFIRNIMEQTMKSEEIKKLMAADEKSKGLNIDSLIDAQVVAVSSPEAMGKMQEEFEKTFQQIIEKGEKKGIRWNEAKLTGYTLDTVEVENGAAPFQPKGIKEAKGVIDFMVGTVPYQMAFTKMMYIESEGGWFGADFSQVARKGESLEPDQEGAVKDETTVSQKKTPPAKKGAAPAPKKNTTTKTPVRKKS